MANIIVILFYFKRFANVNKIYKVKITSLLLALGEAKDYFILWLKRKNFATFIKWVFRRHSAKKIEIVFMPKNYFVVII